MHGIGKRRSGQCLAVRKSARATMLRAILRVFMWVADNSLRILVREVHTKAVIIVQLVMLMHGLGEGEHRIMLVVIAPRWPVVAESKLRVRVIKLTQPLTHWLSLEHQLLRAWSLERTRQPCYLRARKARACVSWPPG
eukprot:scaffold21922_cov32-Tisochrysis_lutea.AAC.1